MSYIFAPLVEDGKPAVRPPKKGELFFGSSDVDENFFAIYRKCVIPHGKDNKPIYQRLDSATHVVIEREKLDALVAACMSAKAGMWDGHYSGHGVTADYANAVESEVSAALAAIKEKHDG